MSTETIRAHGLTWTDVDGEWHAGQQGHSRAQAAVFDTHRGWGYAMGDDDDGRIADEHREPWSLDDAMRIAAAMLRAELAELAELFNTTTTQDK